MTGSAWVAALAVGYVLMLFAVAFLADRGGEERPSLLSNPWVSHSLSMAVYCTAWAFYGSVGRAATVGMDFLAIYIGPTLAFLLAPTLLTRMAAYCRSRGVTNVPDLLEALYGRGQALGAVAAVLLVLGCVPYLALQLKAVAVSFDLLTGWDHEAGIARDAAFWASLGFCGFAVLFGARSLAAAERQEGLAAAVAFDSAVKLAAFLAVGIYVTWGVGGGISAIFQKAAVDPRTRELFVLGAPGGASYAQWSTLCLLSAVSVIFLPRQFQMLALEHPGEEQIRRVAWRFPAYLLLINLLVIPMALVGILTAAGGSPDFFPLRIPIAQGNRFMAMIAFLGGFSAATSMMVVSSAALATVVLNHLVMPTAFRRWGTRELTGTLLQLKRLVICVVIFLGYGFYRWVGEADTLVNTGLLTFVAVFQFAPPVLLGFYWSGVRREGAVAGLSTGFALWAYLLILPRLAASGFLPETFVTHGPFGLELLRPGAFLGFDGLDPWTHALVWTLVGNLGVCVVASLLWGDGRAGKDAPPQLAGWAERADYERLLARFLGPARAAEVFDALGPGATPRMVNEAAERALAGALGTVSARVILRDFLSRPKAQSGEILDVFGSVSLRLAESRDSLERRLRELSVLHEASRLLSSSLDVDVVLNKLLELIRREFGFEHLSVRLPDERGRLGVRAHIGLDPEYIDASRALPSRDTLFGRAFLDGQPLVVSDADAMPPTPGFTLLRRTLPVTALIHVPMIHEGRSVGVLSAYSTQGPLRFTDELLSLIGALANQMAMAVVGARLYQEVHDYSHSMEEMVRQRTAQLEAANERLRELDRMKSDFLSNVSHELRTPLTSIQSFSEILLRYDVADEAKRRRFASIIHEEATRLTRMINDLLDLSKIEAGRLDLDLEPVDVPGVVSRAVNAAEPLFAPHRIWLAAELEPGLPPVRANEDRLLQVLTNLLGNAAKFSPPESRVVVRARRRGAFAVFSVTDEGKGIDPRMLREVFDRYTQLRDPAKKRAQGTGLGLAICRELVEMMGGYIWVESALGRGATFYFTLPFASEEASAAEV